MFLSSSRYFLNFIYLNSWIFIANVDSLSFTLFFSLHVLFLGEKIFREKKIFINASNQNNFSPCYWICFRFSVCFLSQSLSFYLFIFKCFTFFNYELELSKICTSLTVSFSEGISKILF